MEKKKIFFCIGVISILVTPIAIFTSCTISGATSTISIKTQPIDLNYNYLPTGTIVLQATNDFKDWTNFTLQDKSNCVTVQYITNYSSDNSAQWNIACLHNGITNFTLTYQGKVDVGTLPTINNISVSGYPS